MMIDLMMMIMMAEIVADDVLMAMVSDRHMTHHTNLELPASIGDAQLR